MELGKTEPFPPWAYDASPDIQTEMGKELVKINSEIPSFPAISEVLLGEQKFRPAFGPIPWQMLQKPNSVKILFIGQDGTHIAEAAGRPATAGFGGRAQDLAKYFGVGPGAAFINAYAFTIKGQDGSNNLPIALMKGGAPVLQQSRVIENNLWLMSRDLNSPIVQWRDSLIEWIIRNNRDSLKMIVTFGKPAQDAAAAFVMSRAAKYPRENQGTNIGSRFTAEQLESMKIRVPEFKTVPLGGNGEGPVLVGSRGQDLFKEVLGLSNPDFKYDEKTHAKAMNDFIAAFEKNPEAILQKMVFSNGGLRGSGVVHPAQIGGYMIGNRMVISPRYSGNSEQATISLRGLKIADDMEPLNRDLLIVDLPHPTYLTNVQMDYEKAVRANPALKDPKHPKHPKSASEVVAEKVEVLRPYVARGWKIDPDFAIDEDTNRPFTNAFADGKPYRYGRADMGPEFYDFGAPASRMVNVSSAIRLNRNVVVFGSRDDSAFDRDPKAKAVIKERMKARPENFPAPSEMWTTRPRNTDARFIFDPGPPMIFAKMMKEYLPKELIDSHPVNRDYGHYRGTFLNPKVLILADQDGWDDLITARALTGTRGQYLHGLMKDIGVGEDYLIIKTAPFASEEPDWRTIFEKTKNYRAVLIDAILKSSKPLLILTDGDSAAADIDRLLQGKTNLPKVMKIKRVGASNDSGLADVARAIKDSKIFGNFEVKKPHMADIPRRHLSYYARLWEGTSGDRVITAFNQEKGKSFAEIVPEWASEQKLETDPKALGIMKLLQIVDETKIRRGGEEIQDFVRRVER